MSRVSTVSYFYVLFTKTDGDDENTDGVPKIFRIRSSRDVGTVSDTLVASRKGKDLDYCKYRRGYRLEEGCKV